MNESKAIHESECRQQRILDAHYEAANLPDLVKELKHLSKDEQTSLLSLLQQFKHLFDGTLGEFNCPPVDLELHPDATVFYAWAFPDPKIHEETLKKELNRLCELKVLQKVNTSEWASPTFIIPKKNGTVCFVSDFWQLNKWLHHKPFPIPKIQDILQKLEGFTYATSLDVNMGYLYHTFNTASAAALHN